MGNTFREKSKQDWATTSYPTLDEINCGSLQRIADATEKMCQKYNQMERDLEVYKEHFENHRKLIDSLCRQISGYKGYLKRIKNNKPKN